MSRKIIANLDSWHKITMRGEPHKDSRIILVGSGKRSYLWAGRPGRVAIIVSGPVSLRKFAKAILKEVGDDA